MENLGVSWSALIFQAINFGIVVWILQKFLLGPVQKMLADRKAKIDQSMKDAETIEKRLVDVEKEVTKTLNETSKKADKILAEAKKAGQELKAQLKADAEVEAAKIVDKAKTNMAEEEAQMMKQVESNIAGLVQRVTEEVLADYLTDKDRDRITGQAIKHVSQTLQ